MDGIVFIDIFHFYRYAYSYYYYSYDFHSYFHPYFYLYFYFYFLILTVTSRQGHHHIRIGFTDKIFPICRWLSGGTNKTDERKLFTACQFRQSWWVHCEGVRNLCECVGERVLESVLLHVWCVSVCMCVNLWASVSVYAEVSDIFIERKHNCTLLSFHTHLHFHIFSYLTVSYLILHSLSFPSSFP